ncbi:MAG: methyltransferase domain-containing protein [Nanoarchaeota archaeon]|nr:methyltransferase domain-containing protein [Nanoarchaeota archaeon]
MVSSITVQQKKSWKPDRPTSRGATAFHDAVMDASWLHNCVDQLIKYVGPKIKEKDVVVDFGAGTGTSSTRILKKFKSKISLWLVDNSPAWLGKAYEYMHSKPNVDFFVLEKKNTHYSTLSETVGKESVNNVLSSNTVHLIPDLKDTFKGIFDSLKSNGVFIFNSGNIERKGKPKGALMLDSTVYRVHDIAIDLIKKMPQFKDYREGLDKRIKAFLPQRKFIFPYPRDIREYVNALKDAGFGQVKIYYSCFKVKYSDYLKFLRVKRLQAGMLPEVGGREPNPKEIEDRDELITQASSQLFDELKKNNPLADDKSWQCEFAFVSGVK